MEDYSGSRKGGKMVHIEESAARALVELKEKAEVNLSDKAFVSALILLARDTRLNLVSELVKFQGSK